MPLSTTLRDYGDWRIEKSSALIAAVTTNESGSLFGLLCGSTCSYYINMGQECDVGTRYPGLLNGAGEAVPITLRCFHVKEDGEVYPIFLIDEDLTGALGGAAEIGIAVPLRNGQFSVSRFSMAGAEEAQIAMLKIADKTVGPSDSIL